MTRRRRAKRQPPSARKKPSQPSVRLSMSHKVERPSVRPFPVVLFTQIVAITPPTAMSTSDQDRSSPVDGEAPATTLEMSFPKRRLRIPGIEDLVLPSSNHSDDPQPSRKRVKRAFKTSPTPGIIYISRLPPGMTHQKVKHVLNGYGEIGRIYAQQKDGKAW